MIPARKTWPDSCKTDDHATEVGMTSIRSPEDEQVELEASDPKPVAGQWRYFLPVAQYAYNENALYVRGQCPLFCCPYGQRAIKVRFPEASYLDR